MKNLRLNLNLQPKRKNILKKNKTCTTENNNKNKNKRNSMHSKFGENLLVCLLKKSKYMINSRNPSAKRKSKNYFEKNIENKNQLSEKFKNIPGINKLHYLTDHSMNELLKTEQDKYSFRQTTPNNIFTNFELKKRVKNIYNTAFGENKKLSLTELKNEDEYKDKNIKNEFSFFGINLSNKLKKKSKDNIINNKLFSKFPIKNFINNSNSNYMNKIKIKNNKANIKNKDSIFYLMKKNKKNEGIKLLFQPNENSQDVILKDNNIIYNKKCINKKISSEGMSRRKAYTHDNLFDENKYFKNQFENTNKNNKININNGDKKKKNFLNKSSKVDRLIFQLENPYECFEDNVSSNRPEDKFILFKNQIRKQKNKTIKMFYDYKMDLRENEIHMTRYIYKLYSDRHKNKIII